MARDGSRCGEEPKYTRVVMSELATRAHEVKARAAELLGHL
jgi:hypothetical protein